MKRAILLIILLTTTCLAQSVYNSFNGGELSPLLKYRMDLEKRSMGVEQMDNFLVKPQGVAMRRPGTEYIASIDITRIGTDPELTHTIAISDVNDLQAMADTLDGNFYLTNDIDCSATTTWNAGAGFAPVGTTALNDAFTGTLDGQGYIISDLFIDRGSTNYVALFGVTDGATFYNFTIADANITALGFGGLLVGSIQDTTIQAVHVGGVLTAGSQSGGLIGGSGGGGSGNTVSYCTSDVDITSTGDSWYGLFVGTAQGDFSDCYATGTITASAYDNPFYNGGFIGISRDDSSFTRCSCSGTIPGQWANQHLTNGGFVGYNFPSVDIVYTDCYYLPTMDVLPFGGEDEQQTCDVNPNGAPSGGHVHITFDGVTTGEIAHNADEAGIQTALDAAFGTGVIDAGSSSVRYLPLYFRKQYSRTNVDDVSMDVSALTGDTYSVVISTTNEAVYPDVDYEPSSKSTINNIITNEAQRLIPFEYSTDDTYIIEHGNQYMRFYRNGGQILDDSNDVYAIYSTYTAEQIPDVHYIQDNDVMYMVHPDVAPQKLSRYDHNDWTIADVDWTWGPFLDENTTTTTITPTGTTGSITLTASSAIFNSGHVGSIWEITEKSDNTYTSGTLSADGNSTEVQIEGEYLLTLERTWDGLIMLEKSDDDTTWEPVYPKLDGDAANVEYSGDESKSGYSYRVTMSDHTSGRCKYTLTAYNTDVAGYVEITSYSSTTSAAATVIETLAGTDATTKWAEGAWSDYRGWPRAICFYQNRLCLAGTSYQPNTIWLSQSADYENMEISSLDTGAIVYEAGSAKQNPIMWLTDKSGIIAGTTGSLINISSQSGDSTLTAKTIGSERQAENGSCGIQAQLVDTSVIFVDRNRRNVRDLIYSLESDSMIAPDLTIMAEHITDPNLIEMAVQRRPDTIIWFARSDGDLITCTYDRDQRIVAWTEHSTDGDFESVAVIPGDDEDEVWTIVERTIDSNDVRYVERFKPQDWGDDPNDCWFVDSGLKYTGSETDTITGLGHLEGEELQIFYGGNSVQTATVSDGEISVDPNVTEATIGMDYTSTLQTFPIEVAFEGGFTLGYKKRVTEIFPSFYKTMMGEYGWVGQFATGTTYPLAFHKWPDTYIGTYAPFTGQLRKSVDGGWDYEVRIQFVQDEPFPFNLTSLAMRMEFGSD